MWLENCFPGRKEGPPSEEAYRKACLKIPVEMVIEAAVESHRQARSEKDELYHGMRVIIVDGSRCIIPRTKETIEAYGLGSGTTGDAYYPQIYLAGFLDLASGTFADMDFDSGTPRERQLMIKHAEKNTESTLYISDAGFNGMAHVFMLARTGHKRLVCIGKNEDELGPRFPDMSEPYNLQLIELAESVALENKIKVHKGVYVAVSGPNLETKAEYRFLRAIGADVVGMSTVPENIVANHMGMRVLGFSIITDECFPDSLKQAVLEEIIEAAMTAEPKMTLLMKEVIKKL